MSNQEEAAGAPLGSDHQLCGRSRREFLWNAGMGFAGTALTGMLGDEFFRRQVHAADGVTPWDNPLAPKAPHFAPRAKSVIFLYMYGGPSQIDTFDYKPGMRGMDGKTIQVKTFGRGGHKNEGRIVEPRWKFKPYGECGKYVSDLFPHLGQHVDKIGFVHSMIADSPIHGSAMLQMNTGKIQSGSPCLGSWVNYGLGSMNRDLPGFVVMLDPRGGPISGPKNWASGYMPATYQATVLRSGGTPILDLARPENMSDAVQRKLIDAAQDFNREHQATRQANSDLAARIASYELAYKMQSTAPEAVDLEQRGLLNDTLIVWGGEFGRQPTAEYAKGTGRDHNSYGFTMWLAGGGAKGGISVGQTDELGAFAVEDRYHVKNLHATILTLMGLDPERLTYFFGGLDQKLVGVEGAEPIRQLLA